MIDLAPTFLEYFGGPPKPHILEGRSLLPLLRGEQPAEWRSVAISEFDYSFTLARIRLGTPIVDCRMVMVTDGRWKMVHMPGLRPMLHDLQADPEELVDLGADPRFEAERIRLHEEIFLWLARRRSRITVPDQPTPGPDPIGLKYDRNIDAGLLIGYWDEADLAEEQSKRAGAIAAEAERNK